MHRTYFVPRLIGASILLVTLMFHVGLNAASAQFPGAPEQRHDVPVIVMSTGATQNYQMYGKGNLKKVENPNSKVLNVQRVVGDLTSVLFEALAPGRTRVTFTDQKDNTEVVDVLVISDRVKELREMICRAVPTAAVTVTSSDSGNTIVLSGYVLSNDDYRAVQQLGVAAGGAVINNVRIGGVQQVQLEVIVALVNRSEARQMSFSWALNGNNWFVGSLFGVPYNFANSLVPTPGGAVSNLTQTGAANIPFGIMNSNGSFMGFLQALRTESLAKIIAEPRVTTLSGRPAFIISGGETPLLTSGGTGAPSVSYKQFGTVVNFLPTVLGNGKILLEVRPELSDIDSTLGISIPGVTPTIVPGFRTRSAQVTVQMEDGQTLAIGGLIQNTINGSITRVPILGDLPYLGVLFSQKTFTEAEQELVIMVTPRLVDPIDCCKIPKYLPGRETRSADDFELFLEGILEAPRGVRNLVFLPGHYQAAHKLAPNAYGYPCGDRPGFVHTNTLGGHGSGPDCASGNCATGNCANGNCAAGNYAPSGYVGGARLNGTNYPVANMPTTNVPVTTMPARSMPSPNFPEVQGTPTSNSRVMLEPEQPSLTTTTHDTLPSLGPVTPTPTSVPARQLETRPALPPTPYYLPQGR